MPASGAQWLSRKSAVRITPIITCDTCRVQGFVYTYVQCVCVRVHSLCTYMYNVNMHLPSVLNVYVGTCMCMYVRMRMCIFNTLKTNQQKFPAGLCTWRTAVCCAALHACTFLNFRPMWWWLTCSGCLFLAALSSLLVFVFVWVFDESQSIRILRCFVPPISPTGPPRWSTFHGNVMDVFCTHLSVKCHLHF
jgi:hypothetical protein